MKRSGLIAVLVVALLLAGGVMFMSSDTARGMGVGVNYTAKMLCSCVFVQRRDVEACYADMLSNVEGIPVEIDREARTVRTSIFGVLSGEASYEEGRGCLLH